MGMVYHIYMTPTSILFITLFCIVVMVFLVYRLIQALHRIASRIESTNTHIAELKTEFVALSEILSSSLIKLSDRQRDISLNIEDLEDEVHDEDFYSNSEGVYEEAKKIILQEGKASASLIQRRLDIGYARAARILDQLESDGYVGPAEGSKPRALLKEIDS